MILEKLNIFGFTKAQENAILASILCGEPCLLIGPPGTAKTELVSAIGAALREDSKRLHPKDRSQWFGYQIYDASKLNFEDLIGYPDVSALQKNPPEVRYIPTKSSIWGKKMIAFDELNRCAEDRQSNLFEIIRSRNLHGIPTGNLFIFSTMNPFGDEGTIKMSDALVDRHLFYLRLENFESMVSGDRKRVIARVGNVDGVGLKFWSNTTYDLDTNDNMVNDKLADIGAEIRALLTKASETYAQLKDSIGEPMTQLVDKIVEGFSQEFTKETESIKKECRISGRRAASVLRGIMAVRAVTIAAKEEDGDLEDIMTTITNTVKLCIPIGIGGKLNPDVIARANLRVENVVKTIWPNIRAGKNTIDIDKISMATASSNPIKILDTLLTVNMNEITRNQIFSSLMDKTKYHDKYNNFDQDAYNLVQALLFKLNQDIPGFIPQHVKVDITPSGVEDAGKQQNKNIDPIFLDFKGYLEFLSKKYESTPSLYLAMKAAFYYSYSRVTTHDQIVKLISEIHVLAAAVQSKIDLHKQTTNATNTTSTKTSKKKTESKAD